MTRQTRSRVQTEIDRWRMSWQEVETFIDRVEGSRDEDAPYRVRSLALHDAAIVLERLRFRRDGTWMPHPHRMHQSGNAQLANSVEERKYELPGPVDIELAVAGLELDREDGKPVTDPPKVRLFGSEYLFDVWDEEEAKFVELVSPEYCFGRLMYPAPATPHPYIPGLSLQVIATPELGDSDGSDDSLFSFPRREAAAEEGIVELKKWSALRAERWQAINDDAVVEQLAAGQPELAQLRQHVEQGSFSQARTLTTTALAWANVDAARLVAARTNVEELDAEDEALGALTGLSELVAAEVSKLTTLQVELSKPVTAARKAAALALVDGLPTLLHAAPFLGVLYAELDSTIAERIAYPDGPLRSLRTLEVAMAKMWRSRKIWFAHRAFLLGRLMSRFLAPFINNLTALVQTGSTQLSDGLVGARVAIATAAGADQLPLQVSVHALRNVRAGEIAVIGGSRPSLAIVVGVGTPSPVHQRVNILPLRVSQARGIGLDGIPGLVADGSQLQRTVQRPLVGVEYQRGARVDEPEADAIPQDVVALWSRLKLIRGAAFALSLPAPFDSALELPVHATRDAVLVAHAPSLLLPTAPIDRSGNTPRPLVGSAGEVLLLRGRDANGQWWQGVVAVASSQVTTMEAQDVTPQTDPNSPICCQSETPIVLVSLSENTLPVDLVEHVSVHRHFEGFGWPTIAVGKSLPAIVDPETKPIAAEPMGAGYRFVANGSGAFLDRGPELEAAALLFQHWTGRR